MAANAAAYAVAMAAGPQGNMQQSGFVNPGMMHSMEYQAAYQVNVYRSSPRIEML